MMMKYSISYLWAMIIPILLSGGCGYTQPYRTPPIVPRGNVVQFFPSQYFVDVLDSTEVQGRYIVIDTVAMSEDNAIKIAWGRDADAFINVYYKPPPVAYDYYPFPDGPIEVHKYSDLFCYEVIKFINNIVLCDSPIVSFTFTKRSWISAAVIKYNGPVVLQFEDERKEYFELETKNLEPGIYEVHVRAGENPLWTHRGSQWETSRWIEIVK